MLRQWLIKVKQILDMGAYEIADAQLKIGFEGNNPNPVFTISSLGTYWERNQNGTFVISTQPTYATSSCTASVNNNIDDWKGWDLGWINRGAIDPNKSFAHGIYKISYGSNFIYLDYRDALLRILQIS